MAYRRKVQRSTTFVDDYRGTPSVSSSTPATPSPRATRFAEDSRRPERSLAAQSMLASVSIGDTPAFTLSVPSTSSRGGGRGSEPAKDPITQLYTSMSFSPKYDQEKKEEPKQKQGLWGLLANQAKVMLDEDGSGEDHRNRGSSTTGSSESAQSRWSYDRVRKPESPKLTAGASPKVSSAGSPKVLGGAKIKQNGVEEVSENRTCKEVGHRKLQIRRKASSMDLQSTTLNPPKACSMDPPRACSMDTEGTALHPPRACSMDLQGAAQTRSRACSMDMQSMALNLTSPDMSPRLSGLSDVESPQIKASRDVASAMSAKVKLLQRELKTLKADLAFSKERCAQLEDENRLLRSGSQDADEDMIRQQLETLLGEKARLATDNTAYARENRFLREIVEFHRINMQDMVELEEDNGEECQRADDGDEPWSDIRLISSPLCTVQEDEEEEEPSGWDTSLETLELPITVIDNEPLELQR